MLSSRTTPNCAGSSRFLASMRLERRHLRQFAQCLHRERQGFSGAISCEALAQMEAKEPLVRIHLDALRGRLLPFLELHGLSTGAELTALRVSIAAVEDRLAQFSARLCADASGSVSFVSDSLRDLSASLQQLTQVEECLLAKRLMPVLSEDVEQQLCCHEAHAVSRTHSMVERRRAFDMQAV